VTSQWQKFREYFYFDDELGIQVDVSRSGFSDTYLDDMEIRLQDMYCQIQALEQGAVANPDEQRMVGHYWLSDPELAPQPEIGAAIKDTLHRILYFAQDVHAGTICGQKGRPFRNVIVVGIGGSSLGPRFVSEALGKKGDPCSLYFIDNTDPDGMDRIFAELDAKADATLTIVISKSGGTVETRNGMEEVRHFYVSRGLDFSRHAVSITQPGSGLDQIRMKEDWLDAFPVWEWVGGRTSVLSAVGLLPLALQGIDISGLLDGAKKCNALTRNPDAKNNPAALIALAWYVLTGGKGGKQMVILPYKDRLELFPKYLQQLIMESLGKEKDLDGNIVHQGITVLGNKGTSDQHSYIQQLLDGPGNFFVTFIEVLKDRDGDSIQIAEESTSGDYLQAFLLGTRNALSNKGRKSITLTVRDLSPVTIGVLIALYERTVSMYAQLVHVNAYHQPAVEMAKKGAQEMIQLKNLALRVLRACKTGGLTVEEIALEIEADGSVVDREMLYKILKHLEANRGNRIISQKSGSEFEALYQVASDQQ
jgi:Glucose-6-phosphate isomerase